MKMDNFSLGNNGESFETCFVDVTDPVGDVMRFIQKFDEDHGILHPTFYQGTYSQVVHILRFFIVFIRMWHLRKE